MNDLDNKKKRDKRVLEVMISIYCRKKHHSTTLCDDCAELLDYALQRIDNCPVGIQKTSCRQCEVHCYSPSRSEAIREVMRFSGPRMIFCHPIITIRHLIGEKM